MSIPYHTFRSSLREVRTGHFRHELKQRPTDWLAQLSFFYNSCPPAQGGPCPQETVAFLHHLAIMKMMDVMPWWRFLSAGASWFGQVGQSTQEHRDALSSTHTGQSYILSNSKNTKVKVLRLASTSSEPQLKQAQIPLAVIWSLTSKSSNFKNENVEVKKRVLVMESDGQFTCPMQYPHRCRWGGSSTSTLTSCWVGFRSACYEFASLPLVVKEAVLASGLVE